MFVLLGLTISSGYSQENTLSRYLEENLPQSPNAAAISQFADTPVSLSTGSIGTNIPILNVKSKKLSLPISIAYHGGGIKLLQEAGNVGLGWALNAGGTISRSVVGRPDEHPLGFRNVDCIPDESNNDCTDAVFNNWDFQSDLFSFNFMGKSGLFITDKMIEPIFLEKNNLDIEFIGATNSWKAIDEQGTVYLFEFSEDGIVDSGSCESPGNPISHHTMTWYLTEVKSYDEKDIISLTYEELSDIPLESIASSTKFINASVGNCGNGGSVLTCGSLQNINQCKPNLYSGNVVLKNIETSFYSVDFTYESRWDLVNAVKLSEILLKKKANNNLLQKHVFSYDYFSAGQHSKLRLKSLNTEDHQGQNLPPYSFSYNSDDIFHTSSKQVDHWGYQNLNSSISASFENLLPSFPFTIGDAMNFGNTKKKSDVGSLKGMLSRIDYPSGWFEEFKFELNDVAYLNSNTEEIPPQFEQELEYLNCYIDEACDDIVPFEIFSSYNLLNLQITWSQCPAAGDCQSIIVIEDSNGNKSNVYLQTNIHGERIMSVDLELEPDTYVLSVDRRENIDISIDLLYYQPVTINNPGIHLNKKVGGARIKEITTPDGITSYEYLHENKSTGILIDIPEYVVEKQPIHECCFLICPGIELQSNSISQSISGNHLMYSRVKVTYPDLSYDINEFEFAQDYIYPNHFPIRPNISSAPLRGQVKKVSNFSYDPNSLSHNLVKEVTNYYTQETVDDVNILKNGIKGSFSCGSSSVEWTNYDFHSLWKRMTRTEEKTYSSLNNENSLVIIKDYEYDYINKKHTNPISESVVNSDGNIYKTEYLYTTDYDINTAIQTELNNRNIIIPYKTESYISKDNGNIFEQIDGNYTEYDFDSQEIYPKRIFEFEKDWSDQVTSGNYILKQLIDSYDQIHGNPERIILTGWLPIEFEWDNYGNLKKFKYNANDPLEYKRQIREYIYHDDNNLLKSTVEIDNSRTDFFYDSFLRMNKQMSYGTDNTLLNTSDFIYNIGYNKNSIESKTTYVDGTPTKLSSRKFDNRLRPKEEIAHNFVNGVDVVTVLSNYDERGRKIEESILPNAQSHLVKNTFELSSLNRLLEQEFPGENAPTKKIEYDFEGEFIKNNTVDELNRTSSTLQDKIGRTISNTDALGQSTTYNYYDNGQINTINSPNGEEYNYSYFYNNLVATKTIPGIETGTQFSYTYYPDTYLLESETQPNGNKLIYYYDEYGRVITIDLESNGNVSTITRNFYDSYDEIPSDNNIPQTCSLLLNPNPEILKGKLVATMNKLLSGNQDEIWSVYYYDEFGRQIEVCNSNPADKKDITTFIYNSANLATLETRSFDDFNISYINGYDTWDRPLSITAFVGSQSERLTTNRYNLEGLLAEKTLGTNLQSLDYDYNERGWLRRINQNLAPFQYGNALNDCAGLPTTEFDNDITDVIGNYMVSLKQLLDMRFNIQFTSGLTSECTPKECPQSAACIPDANGDFPNQQLAYESIMDSILEEITTIEEIACDFDGVQSTEIVNQVNIDLLVLPLEVVRIRFCNGSEVYLLKKYLDQIPDGYVIEQTISITSYEQTFEIRNNGVQTSMSLTDFLNYVIAGQSYDTGTTVNVENYVECGEDECLTIEAGCSSEEALLTQQAIQRLQNNAPYIKELALQYPITLHYIQLCDGSTLWVLADELFQLLNAPYTILDTITLDDAEDQIEIADPITKTDKTDLFCLQLDYEANGNIKRQLSQVAGRSIFKYEYQYDNIDRLKDATFSEHFSINEQALKSLDNRFGVNNITYSPDGNILSLNRKGINGYCNNGFADYGDIDQLTYNYNDPNQSNRLSSVADATGSPYGFAGLPGSSYTYDFNGNLKSDPYKGITDITYNHLNLPNQILGASNQIDYLYDASGVKWQKISGGITTDYYGGIEYKDGSLEAIYHNDGRIVPNDAGGYQYEYCIKDHLGNTRVTFTDADGNRRISINEDDNEFLQEQHYYPFGMSYENSEQSPWHKYPTAGGDSKYLYNGKEVQGEVFRSVGGVNVGLGLYDYGARFYDPSIARWTSVDPLADVIPEHSPYAYVFNNPINYNDPTGMMGEGLANEYDAEVNEDGTVNFVYVSDKGGDDIDYINWKDSDGNALGTTEHVVEKEYNSGPGTSYTQHSNPTPGHRVIHGSTPLVFEALLYLSGEKLLAKLGGWLWGLRAAKGTAPLALGTTRMRLLRDVQNPRLKKMIEVLYRDGAKYGNGSTGSMIREELINGTITSASGSHLIKAQGALNSMRKLLKGNYGTLSAGDRKIVFEVIEDLTRGTGLKW